MYWLVSVLVGGNCHHNIVVLILFWRDAYKATSTRRDLMQGEAALGVNALARLC